MIELALPLWRTRQRLQLLGFSGPLDIADNTPRRAEPKRGAHEAARVPRDFWIGLKQLARPIRTAIALSSIGIALYLGSDWLRALSPGRSLLRSTASMLLSVLIAVYPIVLAAAVFGLALSAWTIARSRSRGDCQPGWQRHARAAHAVCSCAAHPSRDRSWPRSVPRPGSAGSIDCPRCPRSSSNRLTRTSEFTIVVIGGSSALGVPYEDWLSVGAIVGRELERAIPSRRFRVEVLAEKGATLEAMQLKLAGLTRRPDALIVYSGHNEFVAPLLILEPSGILRR